MPVINHPRKESWQKMKPKITKAKANLFQLPLERVIDLDHPLVQLSREFDWDGIRGEIAVNFCDSNGRPGADTRVVLGLLYLKSAYSLSDEQLLERWVENPYWQWFCGYETMQYQAPIDPTTLSRWRSRLGSEKLEILLKQTLEVASRRKFLNPGDLEQVNVDTTVQPKAIAFPTDTRLYYKMIRILGRLAKKAGLEVRQSYVRKSKQLLIMQNRYAHARQYKRSRMCEKKLKTIMGRLTRDITRKLDFCGSEVLREQMVQLLKQSVRLRNQTRTSARKLYSIHEPHVECIAKGKAHKRYEFGCKVSVAVTNKSNWVVGIKALHGNPYDGHTLAGAVSQLTAITEVEPKRIMVDRGYRGHDYLGSALVHVAGSIPKTATRAFRKMLKRRSVIEPTIGHLKSDHRMERNYLKGKTGDKVNALMSAIGYNFMKLMLALFFVFFCLFKSLDCCLKVALCNLLTGRNHTAPLIASA